MILVLDRLIFYSVQSLLLTSAIQKKILLLRILLEAAIISWTAGDSAVATASRVSAC